MKDNRPAQLMAGLILAIFISFVGYEIFANFERRADRERCSKGKSLTECLANVETPSYRGTGDGSVDFYRWNSGGEFSGSADIVVVAEGNKILDIFNTDKETESEQLHKKYGDPKYDFDM
ncbi:MAG TPA: hypothetical protein VK171_16365 [Fimbriimonas sp.]|nr:hypothetical protein [Fimbriimonas sp.]